MTLLTHNIKLKINGAEIEFDYERIKNEFSSYQETARKDIILLESQLEKEKSVSESERNKRLQQEKETAALQRLWNYPSTSGHMEKTSTPTNVETESVGGLSETEMSIGGISGLPLGAEQGSFTGYNTVAPQGLIGPGIIETLQAQLKQRDGEVYQFRVERTQSAHQREKLAAEVVRLSAIVDEVDEVKGLNQSQKRQLSELEQKYSALLTLYGEKVETVEELELDLSDVKELLKSQTEEWALRLHELQEQG